MTKFDKLLLALTAAGIWALVIQNAVQPSGAHGLEAQLSQWQQREIESIIENCSVTGLARWLGDGSLRENLLGGMVRPVFRKP